MFFCTKCNTNWSTLKSQDDGEESYEFCALCRTDSFIVIDENNTTDLMWMPIDEPEPLPVGFISGKQFKDHQYKEYLTANGITAEEHRNRLFKETEEKELQEAAKRKEKYEARQAELEKRQDEYINEYFKSLNMNQ